jgi:sporulation protein YlmC with PRC-barrel domain
MISYRVQATDGLWGQVQDFCIEEGNWKVKYLVISDAPWPLPGAPVLIEPALAGTPDCARNVFPVSLSTGELSGSPALLRCRPDIPKEKEIGRYFGWPYEIPAVPPGSRTGGPDGTVYRPERFLRSADELIGYRVQASDGVVGRVSDLVADDRTWIVRYFIVRTGTWLPRKKVMIPSGRVIRISDRTDTVSVDMSRRQAMSCPGCGILAVNGN